MVPFLAAAQEFRYAIQHLHFCVKVQNWDALAVALESPAAFFIFPFCEKQRLAAARSSCNVSGSNWKSI